MGTSLTGLTPSTTYDALIKIGDNSNLTASPKTLSDGLGNDLPMQVSTTGVNFTGTVTGIPSTPPSGVSGAIQFSNGSAFASDASKFFWDNTNKRLGIGTNAPTYPLEVIGQNAMLINSNLFGAYQAFKNSSGATHSIGFYGDAFVTLIGGTATTFFQGNGTNTFGNGLASLGARVGIKGSGTTSATTSLLVQNSAGTNILKIGDGARIDVLGTIGQIDFSSFYQIFSTGNGSTAGCWKSQQAFSVDGSRLCVNVAGGSHSASASFQVDSTTTGILPPRMTTTQKNAIASPAAGLVVYDNTTNKLCCYNGSTWNDLF